MTTNLTIKGHKVQLNGTELTGDTYPIKSFIKDYLCGKWNGERKSWTVDLGQVERFMGVQIKADNADAPADARTERRDSWTINTKYGRELAEDY